MTNTFAFSFLVWWVEEHAGEADKWSWWKAWPPGAESTQGLAGEETESTEQENPGWKSLLEWWGSSWAQEVRLWGLEVAGRWGGGGGLLGGDGGLVLTHMMRKTIDFFFFFLVFIALWRVWLKQAITKLGSVRHCKTSEVSIVELPVPCSSSKWSYFHVAHVWAPVLIKQIIPLQSAKGKITSDWYLSAMLSCWEGHLVVFILFG